MNFLIDSGKVYTSKLPLSTNTALKFEFKGTAPDKTLYPSSKLLFSLVYDGNSSLEIRWADGTQDTIGVPRTTSVLLDISSKANGLLGVILDDGGVGLANMVWEEYDNVAKKFQK